LKCVNPTNKRQYNKTPPHIKCCSTKVNRNVTLLSDPLSVKCICIRFEFVSFSCWQTRVNYEGKILVKGEKKFVKLGKETTPQK
jgi:hypothetical protein